MLNALSSCVDSHYKYVECVRMPRNSVVFQKAATKQTLGASWRAKLFIESLPRGVKTLSDCTGLAAHLKQPGGAPRTENVS